ncbi:MAG TPA: hypothetical protein VJN00_06590, partial [Steroidobacteraceae bacterium]|nr:hypothetical protein [Steroidobacteraceae bacterium]
CDGSAARRLRRGEPLAARAQFCGRVNLQLRLPRAHEVAHGTLRADPRPARRTDRRVLIDGGGLGGRQLAVDVWRDERVDGRAVTRAWC